MIHNNEKGAVEIQEDSKERIRISKNTIENNYTGDQNNLLKKIELKGGWKSISKKPISIQ